MHAALCILYIENHYQQFMHFVIDTYNVVLILIIIN